MKRRTRLRRVRHWRVLPVVNMRTPPRDIAVYAAYAQSCRPAWEAAGYGDHDPQVLAWAAVYRDWIGGPWRGVTS